MRRYTMSDGFAYLDIIFFAMVAAFIALRLRSVLGRRTGHERRRPSRFDQAGADSGKVVPLPERDKPKPVEEEIPVADPKDAAVKAGLTEIRLADPSFDLDRFLAGARTAFGMIIEAFAKGDKETLQHLLAPEVYENFSAAIDERVAAGHTLTSEIVAIRGIEILEARLDGTRARITLRFVSEQINVTRDADGHLIDGSPSRIVEVVDIWTFERDVHSRDPNWLLVETRVPD